MYCGPILKTILFCFPKTYKFPIDIVKLTETCLRTVRFFIMLVQQIFAKEEDQRIRGGGKIRESAGTTTAPSKELATMAE